MTREHKLALVVGFGLLLFVGILITDHMEANRRGLGMLQDPAAAVLPRSTPDGLFQREFLEQGELGGRKGGTELAPMSTSRSKSVAFKYASSRAPLVFKYKTRGLGRGCSIGYLSLYPKEEEYLYPPLTFLRPTGRKQELKTEACQFTVVEVIPTIGS